MYDFRLVGTKVNNHRWFFMGFVIVSDFIGENSQPARDPLR